MSDTAASEAASVVEVPPAKGELDFSQFSVGQEYDAKLLAAKNFGVFVDIAKGVDVLIPRSQLTKANFDKLTELAKEKSAEIIKVSLVAVSAENRTLSGKYIQAKSKDRSDLSVLVGKELGTKIFNATVVSAHDFGVFASLDDLKIEGLVPASKLLDSIEKTPGAIKKALPAGSKIIVQIADVNVEQNKLILTMKVGRPGVDAFANMPSTKWFQGIIQSVSNFGLFVRPAGFDSIGLIHNSRVPRDLISALKKRAPIVPGTNATDVECLFAEGDIVKCRIESVTVDTRRLELSMLPVKNVEEDDDYVVEGRDPEGEEGVQPNQDEDEDEEYFDAESTLLWWRGSPYEKRVDEEVVVDEEIEVVNENKAVIEGTWRRMFEIDLRNDENEFSSKALEMELAELAEEIGELDGLDDEMVDSLGFGVTLPTGRLGVSVLKSNLPAGWAEEIGFFKEMETAQSATLSGLRGGKKMEALEMEKLLQAVELELDQAAARGGPRREAAEVASSLEEVASTVPVVEAVIESVTESAAAAEEQVPPTPPSEGV